MSVGTFGKFQVALLWLIVGLLTGVVVTALTLAFLLGVGLPRVCMPENIEDAVGCARSWFVALAPLAGAVLALAAAWWAARPVLRGVRLSARMSLMEIADGFDEAIRSARSVETMTSSVFKSGKGFDGLYAEAVDLISIVDGFVSRSSADRLHRSIRTRIVVGLGDQIAGALGDLRATKAECFRAVGVLESDFREARAKARQRGAVKPPASVAVPEEQCFTNPSLDPALPTVANKTDRDTALAKMNDGIECEAEKLRIAVSQLLGCVVAYREYLESNLSKIELEIERYTSDLFER